MSTVKFKVPGNKKDNAEYTSIRAYFPDSQIESFSISATRSAEGLEETISVDKEDVVVLEFDNDIKWFYDSSEFTEKAKVQQPSGRGLIPGDELVVPVVWQDSSQTRGLITSALKMLGFNVIKNIAGEKLAKSIAHRIEQNNPNILYKCDENFNFNGKFDPGTAKDGSLKYLLLLHGTASSTKGSFEGLVKQQGGNVYKALYKEYGGRIIAFEHKTFTQSPVKNVMELMEQLPANITLDMLSHSRGGLVGEVLARLGDERIGKVFTEKELDLLRQNEDAVVLVEEIESLHKIVAKKQIKINRFVRVACPAAGTTLVSERMETFLNVLFNVLSHIPSEVVSTVVEGLKALVISVVKEKNDVRVLPGIECMKPDSSFIKALNFQETKISSELVVIAGDAQGEGFINRLKMLLVDSFYKEDNDLVVNTSSMKKGTGRTTAFSIYDEQRGDVNHFHYFINATSQNIIYEALAGKTTGSRGFYRSDDIQVKEVKEAVVESSRSAKTIDNQPVLYVLPGIMGSHLEVNADRIWLNFLRMAVGGLERIKIDGADNVKASGINGSAYRDLVNYFSNHYYVVPFAYDWRKSIFDAADELNDHIKDTLTKTNKAVSFIVHSMGGLVFRAFAIRHKETWKELQERERCRVIMLGTPNLGSYAVPRLFMGIGRTINALAVLDLAKNKKALLEQFIRYPGLLQLLPAKGTDDFGNLTFWNDIKNTARSVYPIPDEADLKEYKALQNGPFTSFAWDPAIIKYVAGRDNQTPYRMEIDKENNKVNFYSTPRGDGSVTWDSIPSELVNATYYVNAEHGKLAAFNRAFDAYKELLQNGETEKLSKTPPATRSVVRAELMADVEPVTMPDEEELSQLVMGMEITKRKMQPQPLKISITHGDMGHALYPVIAGHFDGDNIVEAERVLDRKLNNHFSIRFDAGNYPGKISTHELVIDKNANPPGGIVVGLGAFGELTENELSKTLKQALLSYIIKHKEDNIEKKEDEKGLGISYLLIASDFGGLSIYSSIRAIITAVKDANEFFTPRLRDGYNLITHIEIIELYLHKAVQAGRIVQHLLQNNVLYSQVAFMPNTIKKASGRLNEIPSEIQRDWWHRLKVYVPEKQPDDNRKTRVIKFSSITDKARNEEEVLATNINIVDKLIQKAASVNNNDRQLCNTLYELLVPNAFKGYGADLRNIVLIVDKETARYPWEMLQDAYSGSNAPIVTKAGFLRQLSTGTYRTDSRLSANNNALVIGNPLLNDYYPDLPGAAQEARQVADQLKSFGYNVTRHIEKPGEEVILNLSAQFKIIHIAAHGVVNDKITGQTGVVLGKELILTPSDLKQFLQRNLPELVFVNCCSLGVVDKNDEERLQRKYEVAAGVGVQLIEMGVKAVIVAGWEVDDAAAQAFSETFYYELLSGRIFGEAVRIARETTYTNFSDRNTWGAYQCYGDPYYTLRPISEGGDRKPIRFCDTIEAIQMLQSLISRIEAATGRDEEKDKITKELEYIVDAINVHPEWKNDASLVELLADFYKETGNRAKAIEYYEMLFGLEEAVFSVRTIEQYCNIKVKQVVKEYKNDPVKANEIIDACINRLKNIHTTLTSERANLIASAYKRKAEINSNDKKEYMANILASAQFYYEGYEAYLNNKGKVYYYPLFNWLITAAIIDPLITKAQRKDHSSFTAYEALLEKPDNKDQPDKLEQLVKDAEQFAGEMDRNRPDFWNKTAVSNQYLLQLIQSPLVKDVNEYKKKIVENHKTAWSVEGSLNKQNAIKEHVDFIIAMMKNNKERLSSIKLVDQKIKALEALLTELG